jgi:hypothetical protein
MKMLFIITVKVSSGAKATMTSICICLLEAKIAGLKVLEMPSKCLTDKLQRVSKPTNISLALQSIRLSN